MNLSEVLWTVAFVTFLAGAAWSYRCNGAWPAIAVMAAGAILDAAVAFLPQLGVEALSYHMTRVNGVFIAAMAAGLAA